MRPRSRRGRRARDGGPLLPLSSLLRGRGIVQKRNVAEGGPRDLEGRERAADGDDRGERWWGRGRRRACGGGGGEGVASGRRGRGGRRGRRRRRLRKRLERLQRRATPAGTSGSLPPTRARKRRKRRTRRRTRGRRRAEEQQRKGRHKGKLDLLLLRPRRLSRSLLGKKKSSLSSANKRASPSVPRRAEPARAVKSTQRAFQADCKSDFRGKYQQKKLNKAKKVFTFFFSLLVLQEEREVRSFFFQGGTRPRRSVPLARKHAASSN